MGRLNITTHYENLQAHETVKTVNMGEQKEKRPTSSVGNIPDYPVET